MTAEPQDVAVMTTACWRPYYLEQTLGAWLDARGTERVRRFVIGLGDSPRIAEARAVIADFAAVAPFEVETLEDTGKIGPWRAIAHAGNRAFADPSSQSADGDLAGRDAVIDQCCARGPCTSQGQAPAAGRIVRHPVGIGGHGEAGGIAGRRGFDQTFDSVDPGRIQLRLVAGEQDANAGRCRLLGGYGRRRRWRPRSASAIRSIRARQFQRRRDCCTRCASISSMNRNPPATGSLSMNSR